MPWFSSVILAYGAMAVVLIVSHFVMRDHMTETLLTQNLGLTFSSAMVMIVVWAWAIHSAAHPWMASIGLTAVGCLAIILRGFRWGSMAV